MKVGGPLIWEVLVAQRSNDDGGGKTRGRGEEVNSEDKREGQSKARAR